MSMQADINERMRAILIDWLIEVTLGILQTKNDNSHFSKLKRKQSSIFSNKG
jgi:hypothetical protein